MPDKFDAFYTWLGIPPEEQPPDYYRLLGVRRFESNADVISNALDQRMAHIRSFQSGPHAAESQTLLNELSKAGGCLLSVDKRGAYDRELRQKDAPKLGKSGTQPMTRPAAPHKSGAIPVAAPLPAQAAAPAARPPVLPPAIQVETKPTFKPAQYDPPAARPLWQPILLLAVGGLALLLLGGIALVGTYFGAQYLTKKDPKANQPKIAQNPNPAPKPPAPKPPTPIPTPKPKPIENPPPRPAPFNPPPFNPGPPPPFGSVPPNVTMPPAVPTSPNGYALKFSSSDHVELDNTEKIASWNQEGTTELWVRWNRSARDQRLLGTMQYTSPSRRNASEGWQLSMGGKSSKNQLVHHYLGSERRDPYVNDVGPASAIDDKWHHFAYVVGPTKLDIFIDGAPANQSVHWPPPRATDLKNLTLGAPSAVRSAGLTGEIRALRVSSIRRYNKEFTPPLTFDNDATTVALLDFSKNTGAVIQDLSGQGHHGKISGASWVPVTTPPEPPALASSSSGMNPGQWRNESYNTTLRHVKDKEWVDYNNTTGAVHLKYLETARTPEYLELFCPERNYSIRVFATRADINKDGKWGWVSNGKWIVPITVSPPPTTVAGTNDPPRPPSFDPLPPTPSPAASNKLARPKTEEQDTARGLVRDTLKDKRAKAIKAPEKLALSSEILTMAKDVKETPATRYVLYEEARNLKFEAGDLEGAFAIADRVATLFDGDPWKERTAALKKGADAAKNIEQRKRLAEIALNLADAALAEANFDAAGEVSTLATAAAGRAGDVKLKGIAAKLETGIESAKKQREAAQAAAEKLKSEPDDAEANLTVGKFSCLVKRDWSEGLPYLAKGSDAKLKEAAKLEKALPVDAEKTAKAWDAASESFIEREKDSLLIRAREWYTKSLATAGEFSKRTSQKRIDEITALIPKEGAASTGRPPPKIPGATAGLIGRAKANNKDVGFLIKYELGAQISHDKLMAEMNKFSVSGSFYEIDLAGILHVPEEIKIEVVVSREERTGVYPDLKINGKNIYDLPSDRRGRSDRYEITLPKGEHLLAYQVRGTKLGACVLNFIDIETGQPLHVYYTQLGAKQYASLGTRSEVTFSK